MAKHDRVLVDGTVLAENRISILIRLDKEPEGRDARGVTVFIGPHVLNTLAAAQLRMLADEIDD